MPEKSVTKNGTGRYLKPGLGVLLGCLILFGAVFPVNAQDCVILLHGLGRTERSMGKLEDSLQDEGYRVWNLGYESTRHPIPELAETAIDEGLAYCAHKQASSVHFVTHSLGGILVRYYLQGHKIEDLGRIVMLAPPNKGSEVADELKRFEWFGELLGPAALALGTDAASLPAQLAPIPGEIGVIAGNATSDPWFSPMIPGEDDGKVSVARTRLAEMQDFLVVDAGHTFIMRKPAVIKQVLHFLQQGVFSHPPPSRDS